MSSKSSFLPFPLSIQQALLRTSGSMEIESKTLSDDEIEDDPNQAEISSPHKDCQNGADKCSRGTKHSERYQALLDWKHRIEESAADIWLTRDSIANWSYYGLDAFQLSQEWQESTILWALQQLQRQSSQSMPLMTPSRMERRYRKLVKRYKKINARLQVVRNLEFDVLVVEYEKVAAAATAAAEEANSGKCVSDSSWSWTNEMAAIMASSLHEQDRDSLVYHILRQRPDWIVHAAAAASR